MRIGISFQSLRLFCILLPMLQACLPEIIVPEVASCDDTQQCPERFICLEGQCVATQIVKSRDRTIIDSMSPVDQSVLRTDVDRNIDQVIPTPIDMEIIQDFMTMTTLLATTPSDEMSHIMTNTSIILQFSDRVYIGNGDIIITDLTDGSDQRSISINDPQVSISDSTVTLTLSTPLEIGTRYEITMLEGVLKDTFDQNIHEIAVDQFNFTTIPITSLQQIQGLSTGQYLISTEVQNFTGYIYSTLNQSWLLVGRGREGWEFDADGQGTVEGVITHLGTIDAFTPHAYGEQIINTLLASSFINLTNIEILIRRAADTSGSSYQNVLWRPRFQETWRWSFDSLAFQITHDVQNSPLGNGVEVILLTRDANVGNDHRRLFTWGWIGHNHQKGFSYGHDVDGLDHNHPDAFLWEYSDERHAIPYAEIYIRIQ